MVAITNQQEEIARRAQAALVAQQERRAAEWENLHVRRTAEKKTRDLVAAGRLQAFAQQALGLHIMPDGDRFPLTPDGRVELVADTQLNWSWQDIDQVPEKVTSADKYWTYWVLPTGVSPYDDELHRCTMYHRSGEVDEHGELYGICLDNQADPWAAIGYFIAHQDDWRDWQRFAPASEVETMPECSFAFLDENQLNTEPRDFVVLGSPGFDDASGCMVVLVRYADGMSDAGR